MFKKIIVSTALCLGAFGMSACTSNSTSSATSGATVSAGTLNGDQTLSVSATINTGAVTLLPTVLPIFNPKNPAQEIGQLSIQSNLAGGSSLELTVDLDSVMANGGVSSAATLPNGTTIPITGINANNWKTLPIASGKSYLYVNYDQAGKKAVVGVAVNIASLSVGAVADVFIPFMYDNISGLAGIYTGATAGKSGFATFFDASSSLFHGVTHGRGVKFHAKSYRGAMIKSKVWELERNHASLKLR